MKRNSIIVITIALLLIAAGIGAFLSADAPTEEGDGRFKIAATIFPVYDIARNIIGDAGDVALVLPPGSSPHTFTLAPADIRALQGTDAVLKVGLLDDWMDGVTASIGNPAVHVVSEGIALKTLEEDHGHEEDEHTEEHSTLPEGTDPHYWLSVSNGIAIAEAVAGIASLKNPDAADAYQQNLEQYRAELLETDAYIRTQLGSLPRNEIITFHESWSYFADAYGLDVVGIFEPSPGREPSPAYLASIARAAEEHNVRAVFSEPQLPSDVLRPFIEDLGLELLVLDPLGGVGKRDSYINMMRYNAETVADALE